MATVLRFWLATVFIVPASGCTLATLVGPSEQIAGPTENSQDSEGLKLDSAPGSAIYTFTDLAFEFDRASLRPEAKVAIDRLVRYLNENPAQEIILEGFTDSIGPTNYNLDLSQRRADAVRTALIRSGISPTRILARGLGEAKPLAANDTPEGRKRNRRVEVILSKTKS